MWKMVGFGAYLAMFLHIADYLPTEPEGSLLMVAYTLLPVAQCLLLVLCSHSKQHMYTFYRTHIARGLVLSMGGNVGLMYHHIHVCRLLAAIFFLLVLFSYLHALGLEPLGSRSTLAFYGALGVNISLFLVPGLRGTDSVVALGYLFLLLTLAWRSAVRYQVLPSVANLLGCVGCLLFVAAYYVVLRQWFVVQWQYSRVTAMFTYYMAQMGIALSASSDFTATGYEAAYRKIR